MRSVPATLTLPDEKRSLRWDAWILAASLVSAGPQSFATPLNSAGTPVQAPASAFHSRVRGIPQPDLGVQANGRDLWLDESVDFGQIEIGATSVMILKLTNVGQLPMDLAGVKLGAGDSGFSIMKPESIAATLAPDQSTTITVTFRPVLVGRAKDRLAINSSAHSNPVFTVRLQGAGAQAPPNSW